MPTAEIAVEELGTEPVQPAPAVQNSLGAPAAHKVAARLLRFTVGGETFQDRLQPGDPPGALTGVGVPGALPAAQDAAVLWVFGSGGGLGGPAGGIYARLGAALAVRGVTSLELDYRRPGELEPCIEDVLVGIGYLEGQNRRRVVLVGHSFGGAVVIGAAARSPSVVAVCAMSSVEAESVAGLGDRSLLLIHGEQDEVVPHSTSLGLFKRAGAGKQLLLYPDCGHGLDACGAAIDRDLTAWIGAELELPV